MKRRSLWFSGSVALLASACHTVILDPINVTGTGSGAGDGGGSAPGTGAGVTGNGGGPSARFTIQVTPVQKMDLLLAVDNAPGMATKQGMFAEAIPELINGLVNPPCEDAEGNVVVTQPSNGTDACPHGSTRRFPPLLDLHVGMVSSSLGTFGAVGCSDAPPPACPTADTTPADDHGHLVTRSDSCDSTGPIATFNGEGFVAYDAMSDAPAGSVSVIGAVNAGGLVGSLYDIVVGNGQSGCAFQSQNESWYRFLVEPSPYEEISLDTNSQAVSSGIDSVLLKQRSEFLRPDSLLAVVVLSDKTDGSIREYSAYPLFANEQHLPHASAACATSPNDPCCYSCGQHTPSGCAPDSICTTNPSYTAADENLSIRTFGLMEDKQDYGIEFFYEPSRYVNALTAPTITASTGAVAPNPIYSNLSPATAPHGTYRDTSMVLYSAIVGVPWQLIARQNASGEPDLIGGVNSTTGGTTGGFKSAAELSLKDKEGNSIWSDVTGDPEHYVRASSPFMVESTIPRSGTDPITGASISPVTTPNGTGARSGTSANSLLNDHERTIQSPAGDIQYACVFPLPSARDESATGAYAGSGDCANNPADNPLCSPNPNDSGKNTLQTSDRAYPGIKHLAIAEGMGAQGVVGSICPAQLSNVNAADYGYRPAINGLLDRVAAGLAVGGRCIEQSVAADANGQVACVVFEASSSGTCDCGGFARSPVSAAHAGAAADARAQAAADNVDAACLCEVTQAQAGAEAADCETNQHSLVDGWCYVDASQGTKQAAILNECPAGSQHAFRFLGFAAPGPNASLYVSCGQ